MAVEVQRHILVHFDCFALVDSTSLHVGTDSLSDCCQNEYSHRCTKHTVDNTRHSNYSDNVKLLWTVAIHLAQQAARFFRKFALPVERKAFHELYNIHMHNHKDSSIAFILAWLLYYLSIIIKLEPSR